MLATKDRYDFDNIGQNFKNYSHLKCRSTKTDKILYGRNMLEQTYLALYRKWRDETAYISNPKDKFSNEAFIKLTENADKYKSIILNHLNAKPSAAVFILHMAYEKRPYGEEIFGDLIAMSKSWISVR